MSDDRNPTTAYVMTVDGPQSLDRIEAHALNTLSIMPAHVDANDKLLLVREVKRLRQVIAVAFEDLECNNEASAFLVLKNSGVVNHD
jgi:hypothetical protein